MASTLPPLSDALGALVRSLADHPASRGVAFLDAAHDQAAFEDDPSPAASRAMAKSAEDLLDELAVIRYPASPEHEAAKAALERHLLAA